MIVGVEDLHLMKKGLRLPTVIMMISIFKITNPNAQGIKCKILLTESLAENEEENRR